MADLAALGLSIDSSQIDAAAKSLGNFVQSGKQAQVSADVLVASAVRLGISVEEVQRRLAAANDNLETNADLAMKLAEATKQASAANDNLAVAVRSAAGASSDAGKGFFGTIEQALALTGHLKLLAVAAYALSPAFRGFVNSGIKTFLMDVLPVTGLTTKAFEAMTAAGSSMLALFARLGPPILTAVAAFQIFNAVWDKGAALLDKYANSLRALYSDDVVQNLQKLTKGQGEAGDIITAEQIARATELGVRLQDASFIINRFLTTSVINLTDASLKLQTVWVNIVELIAKGAQVISKIPVGQLAEVAAKSIIPGGGAIVAGAKTATNFFFPETNTDSIKAATDRLSAMMGVQNLAKESAEKLGKAVGDVDKEFNIGSSFIARYSDNIKKLTDGVRDADSWDRVAKSIERHTAAMTSNAASVGETIKFQEQLRVETQLLNATKGGLNAATDEQIDHFIELRTKGIDPVTAATEAGIKMDEKRVKSLKEMSEAAGQAKEEFAKANFEIANTRALDADKISARALTAFSPTQKGDIAEAQKRLELQQELVKGIATQEQVDARAASARKLAIQAEIVQLQEARRARELTANQTIDSAKLEIELIGKNIYQQTELRANLQARQQLEQEASQKRTKFDSDQYEALKKINAEYAKQAQMNAIAQTNADIKFGMNTSILSPEDVAIATQLKNIYPDVATALDSVQASGLRASRAMRDISSVVSGQLTTGLADIFDGTKSVKDGFASMSKVVIRAIEEMIIKLLIVGPLMRGLQSAAGGLFGGGGGGGIGNPTQIGSLYHSGGIVGEPTAMRSVDSSLFNFAPRLHGGLMPDEFPAILQKGEGVISRGDMAKGGSRPMVMNDNRVINIGQGASLETVEQLKKVLAEDRSQFANNVVKVVKIAQSGGHFR